MEAPRHSLLRSVRSRGMAHSLAPMSMEHLFQDMPRAVCQGTGLLRTDVALLQDSSGL